MTRCLSTWKFWYFPGKMCSDRRKKPWLWPKNPEGTSSAIFGVGAAAHCCELKRYGDQVTSRNDNKDEVLGNKFVTWSFRLPPKRPLSIVLNFFFPFIDILHNIIFPLPQFYFPSSTILFSLFHNFNFPLPQFYFPSSLQIYFPSSTILFSLLHNFIFPLPHNFTFPTPQFYFLCSTILFPSSTI